MPLTETFTGGLPAVKAAIDVLKASPKPYGIYFAVFVLVSAPRILAIYLLEKCASYCSVVFSNVAGPKQPFYVDGAKVKN